MGNNIVIDSNNLSCLEPLMPSEDAPSSSLKRERSYSNAIRETMCILAEADAVKKQKELKKAEMKRHGRTLLLIFIALYLYAHVFLVHWAAFLAMFLPAGFEIGKRMKKMNMTFIEAAKDSIVCLLLTVLFCFLSL